MSRYLSRGIAAFVAVVLVTLIVPISVLSSRLARTELRDRAERRVALVAAAVTAFGIDGVNTAMGQLSDDADARTLLVAADGAVLADSDPGIPSPVLPDLASVARGELLPDDPDGRIRAAAPVAVRGDPTGAMVLVVLSAESVAERQRVVGVVLIAIGAAIVAAAAGLGAVLARSLVRPVEHLDAQAGALASGDLDARATVPRRPPELRRLAEAFNEMSSRLDTVITSQRAFTSDAAHQLRSPLTVLRLRLEAIEDRAPDDADVAVATAEVHRLQHLIDDLLALARLDRGQQEATVVPLGSVVRRHCDLWSASAEEHGVVLRTRISGDGPLARTVPGGVEQVLDGFLENAMRVAPPGSDVVVNVARQADEAVVQVADRGPGLSEQHRRQAFDRLWRDPDAAADGGTGLGLAIVARIVAASGGRARLDARPGGGTTAVATFPVVDEPMADVRVE